MDYLGRDDAPFSSDIWSAIDSKVVSAASSVLAGRRFIPVSGPLGGGVQFAKIDSPGKSETFDDGFVKTTNRVIKEIPQLYSDFWLYWRDMEAAENVDLSPAIRAAQNLALTEDKMIFYGIPALNLDGLLTAKNTVAIKRGDWSKGEGSYADVAAGITKLEQSNYLGNYTLVLSPDLYLQLQRIQPGTGLLEIDRIKSMLNNRVFKSPVLKEGTAFMVCAQSYCLDLLLGQDIATGYVELMDFNHHFRVTETALLRLKCPDSVIIFK